jgi:hypothetical protein
MAMLLQAIKYSFTHCIFLAQIFFAFTEAIQAAGVEQRVHTGMLLGIVYNAVLLQTFADQ